MTLNDLFEELCRQLDEDTKIKDSERFNNTNTMRFRRETALRITEKSYVYVNNYTARLTLNFEDSRIDCDFRRVHEIIDSYTIRTDGEKALLSIDHIWTMPNAYDIPQLSKQIIDRLLEIVEKF